MNKPLERLYAQTFLRLAAWTNCTIRQEDRERPDFLVDGPEGQLGLEVTVLYEDEDDRGSPVKAAESERASFLQDVAREYYRVEDVPVLVKANLAGRPDSANAPSLARAIGDHRPKTACDTTEYRLTMSAGEQAVFYITALPQAAGQYSRWICLSDSVGWVRTITSDLLTASIRRKARKLEEYQKAANRTVLLMVADHTKNSGMLDFTLPGGLLPACGFAEVHLLVFPQRTLRIA